MSNPPSLVCWSAQPLVSVDGSPLVVNGHARILIQLDTHKEVPFAVASCESHPWVKKNQCTLDLKNNTLLLGDSTMIPLVSERHESTRQLAVSILEAFRLPPTSELEVLGHLQGGQPYS